MRASLRALGLVFSEWEYQRARKSLEGQYKAVRALARKIRTQLNKPSSDPEGVKFYKIAPLVKNEPRPTPKDYDSLFDLVDGAVWATFTRSPGRYYPAPPDLECHIQGCHQKPR